MAVLPVRLVNDISGSKAKPVAWYGFALDWILTGTSRPDPIHTKRIATERMAVREISATLRGARANPLLAKLLPPLNHPTLLPRTKGASLLVIILMLGLSVFCASAGWIEDENGKTIIHVEVHQLPDPSDPSTANTAGVQAVKEFRKRFPQIFAERWRDTYKANPEVYGDHNWDHVEIRLHESTGISVEGVESDLLQIAGGMAPDVLYVNFRKSDNYIRNSFLYPLDEYVAMMPREEVDFRVNKKLWPVIQRRGPKSMEKQIWAFPYGGALGKVLLFRRDLFDLHNLPYPTRDFTWDDMLEVSRTVTDPAKGHYGMLLGRGKHESWYWITFLWSAGGEAMAYDEATNTWSCVFDSPEAAVALDFYTRLCTEKWTDEAGNLRRGYSSKDASESSTVKWDRGEIAMMMSYIDERVFSTINPDLTGMVPVPLGPTGIRGAELNSRMMGLFAEIKEPAVRDAAWEYIRWYSSPDAMEINTRVMVEGGLGRFVNPRFLRQFGYPEIERLAPKGWSEVFEIAIETGKPEPYGRNSNVAYGLMTYPIQEAEQMALNDQLPEDPEARLQIMQDLLKAANARANEEMIGVVTPAERTKRRIGAWIALCGILITFGFVFKRITSSFTPPAEFEGAARKSWDFKRYFWAYILLLPAVSTILVWQYAPLLRGSIMAFYDYRLLGDSAFVGVDNFGDLLFDNAWWQSVWNAMRYSLLVIALTFLPPIILAIALQEVPHFKLFFRLIYYLPAVISGLVTVLLWKQFYQPSDNGALNALILRVPAIGFILAGLLMLGICLAFAKRLWLHELRWPTVGFIFAGLVLFYTFANLATPILFPDPEGFATAFMKLPGRLFDRTPEAYRWLSDPDTAMISCVIPMVWAGMGPGCLIYLAALKGIPNDYYEAADIDGASFIDKILFVIFPTLKALIIINFVGAFIGAWYSATGNILVMTGGGANTEVVGLHIWYKAFTYLKFGPATAMAWMLGFMLIGFTIHQLRILSRVEFRTADGGND